MKAIISFFLRIFRFYYDGFRTLSWWGRRVWVIILIKLFILFAILKLFFFPDFLGKEFSSNEQRSEYVIDQLINSGNSYDRKR